MNVIWLLNILTWGAFFGVAIVPMIIAIKVRSGPLRKLSLLLGVFAVAHGLYHLTLAYGLYFVANIILGPVSVTFLLAFGLYYSKKAAY